MKSPVDAMTEFCPPLEPEELDDCIPRCCIGCGQLYNGPLDCPECGEPGEPVRDD
jgi:hypothetical protein